MHRDLGRVGEMFKRAQWTRVELTGSEGLDATFANSYAIAGILFAESVEQVFVKWQQAQEGLRDLKASNSALRDSDAYLVILVPRIDVRSERLSEVLDNTYVCRKICVEIDGTTIEEALRDLPFLALAVRDDGSGIKTEIRGPRLGLPDSLLQDLMRVSPESLLDSLLEGKYHPEAK